MRDNLREGLSEPGQWWLPGATEEQIQGTLRYVPGEGTTLDLLARFPGHRDFVAPPQEIILGTLLSGKHVTLWRCFEVGSPLSPALANCSFFANRLFVGTHFLDPEDISFSKISMTFSTLNQWTNARDFDWQHDHEKGLTTVTYRAPEEIVASTSENVTVTLRPSLHSRRLRYPQPTAELSQKWYLTIDAPSTSSDELDSLYFSLRNFLTLAVGMPAIPQGLRAERVTSSPTTDSSIETVDVYNVPVGWSLDQREAFAPEMRFDLPAIRPRFGELISRWFELSRRLGPVLEAYFSGLYGPSQFQDERILNLTQELEGFHRRTSTNEDLPLAQHEERVAKILEGSPAEHKEWLKEELRYSNEPSLRKRLRSILEQHRETVKPAVRGKDNDFIGKIVDTRNYLTHYTAELEKTALRGHDIMPYADSIEFIFIACLLRELGFSPSECTQMMRRDRVRIAVI